jgi:DNA-binding transcriptional regulator YbjK
VSVVRTTDKRKRYSEAISTAISPTGKEQVRQEDGARLRILRSTFELIGRGGIAALSNRRIAADAEVSLGSLTYHFPSQAELLRESLSLYVEEEIARLETIAADLRAARPGTERVAAEVQRLAAENADRPQQIAELELHLHAARDPGLQETSRRCFAAYEGLAAAALEALGVPDAPRHAHSVIALMTGMGVQRLGTGRHDADGTAAALLTIVRGALAEGRADSSGASLQDPPRTQSPS